MKSRQPSLLNLTHLLLRAITRPPSQLDEAPLRRSCKLTRRFGCRRAQLFTGDIHLIHSAASVQLLPALRNHEWNFLRRPTDQHTQLCVIPGDVFLLDLNPWRTEKHSRKTSTFTHSGTGAATDVSSSRPFDGGD